MRITTEQAERLVALIKDGVDTDTVSVHPYSGAATLTLDGTTVAILDPAGVVTYAHADIKELI